MSNFIYKLFVITLHASIFTNGFLLNSLPKKITNKIDAFIESNSELKIFQPNETEYKQTVIFLPAKSGKNLPYQLYNDFIDCMLKKNMKIYIPNIDLNIHNNNFIDSIDEIDNDITLVAHSTSAVSAIHCSNNNNFINRLVLIDPLDTRKLEKSDKVETDFNIQDINKVNDNEKADDTLKLDNIDKLTVFYSKKSNAWKLTPPFIPIGFFNLKLSDININKHINKTTEFINNFGHFDILDLEWSNIAHNIISKGNPERKPDRMLQYHMWLANKIYNSTDNE